MIAVGTIDNLLYPLLVGDKVRLHTLLVFFAVVGGLFVFGAPGLVLRTGCGRHNNYLD